MNETKDRSAGLQGLSSDPDAVSSNYSSPSNVQDLASKALDSNYGVYSYENQLKNLEDLFTQRAVHTPFRTSTWRENELAIAKEEIATIRDLVKADLDTENKAKLESIGAYYNNLTNELKDYRNYVYSSALSSEKYASEEELIPLKAKWQMATDAMDNAGKLVSNLGGMVLKSVL